MNDWKAEANKEQTAIRAWQRLLPRPSILSFFPLVVDTPPPTAQGVSATQLKTR